MQDRSHLPSRVGNGIKLKAYCRIDYSGEYHVSQSNFKTLAEILSSEQLPERQDRDFVQSELFKNWASASGEDITQQTERIDIVDDVLQVHVSSPTWAHEIINRQTTLLKRMRGKGYRNLMSLSVSVHVPKTKKDRFTAPPAQKPRPVTPQMREVFKRFAENSKDPELKARFKRLGDL